MSYIDITENDSGIINSTTISEEAGGNTVIDHDVEIPLQMCTTEYPVATPDCIK